MSQTLYRNFALTAGGFVLCLLCACAQQNPTVYTPLEEIKASPPPEPAPVSTYRIGPGDELEIKFFFAPELNDTLTVRPDGKISIMFAQDIQAAGLTPEELATDIRTVLAPHIKQLDLVVIVKSFASQKAYVGGEVMKPGPVPLTGEENVLQVLATAGWVTPASGDKVVLVRRDASGAEKLYPVELSAIENGRDMAENIPVRAGDLILVPPSGAVESDRWVDQNIRQLLPFTVGAGISYNINANPITQ